MQSLYLSKKTRPAWSLLLLALLISIFASLKVKNEIERNAVNQFSFNCDEIALKIQERLRAYALTIRGGAAFFTSSNVVGRQEWKSYVETLQAQNNVLGVQGMGFNQLIRADQLKVLPIVKTKKLTF